MAGQRGVENEEGQVAGEAGPAFTLDSSAEAFEALRGELRALRQATLAPLRVDAQRAAAVAYSVALRDAEPARRSSFERLAAGGFYQLATLERLPRLAQAVWFAGEQQRLHEALASEARVPNEVVREARAQRARVRQVLTYWFGRHPDIAAELAYRRRAVGYVDRVSDLNALARLYERDEVRAILADSDPNYRETDADDARRLARAIFAGLGVRAERETQRWTSHTQRAFTLLSRAYEAHRRSGLYAFGEREDVGRTYPTLVTAVRARPRRAPKGSDGEASSGPRGAKGSDGDASGDPAEGRSCHRARSA
ncbi:MAG TPA: hypothetical protein VFS43_16535 [Polyangiaceae bacterium]|nr:hypothetical protein [Polyangiaceae bacterium]